MGPLPEDGAEKKNTEQLGEEGAQRHTQEGQASKGGEAK